MVVYIKQFVYETRHVVSVFSTCERGENLSFLLSSWLFPGLREVPRSVLVLVFSREKDDA